MRARHIVLMVGSVGLAAFAAGVSPTLAQQAPPRDPPPAMTKLLANMDLDGEIVGLQGKSMRTRLVTIRPGGKLAEHSHEDRASVMYLTEGRIIEHRRNFAKEYVAGDTFVIGTQVPHWSENPGTTSRDSQRSRSW